MLVFLLLKPWGLQDGNVPTFWLLLQEPSFEPGTLKFEPGSRSCCVGVPDWYDTRTSMNTFPKNKSKQLSVSR